MKRNIIQFIYFVNIKNKKFILFNIKIKLKRFFNNFYILIKKQ